MTRRRSHNCAKTEPSELKRLFARLIKPGLLLAGQRLSALDFETLGAHISLDARIDWQYDDADTPLACAVLRLTAQHRTTTPTLTA